MAQYAEQLVNYNNYYVYQDLVNTGIQNVYTRDLTNTNYNDYFMGLMNIFRDGIETEEVQCMMINIIFDDGQELLLNIMDYFFNLIMWRSIIDLQLFIQPTDLFIPENITQDVIKNWIDDNFLIKYRDETNILKERGFDSEMSNIILNQCIDNSSYEYSYIDEFAFYLLNTINLEDDIALGKVNPRFYQLLHGDYSGVPVESVKNEGMKATSEVVDIISNSEHCLRDSFRAKEGINPKQYREFEINRGVKPDGQGSVFPILINSSFVNASKFDLGVFFTESFTGRLAQIIAKCNVGTAGAFGRILGLNNRDSILYPDPNYVCDSKAFEIIIIKDASYLYSFEGRYYRTHPLGMEKCLSINDKHLIGQKLYFRSPMKCASASRGKGVCYRCYGKLAYTNASINIGQYAAEVISSRLTQKQLSAKHLLEALVIALRWIKDFEQFFDVEYNTVKLKENIEIEGYKILIDPEGIHLESEEDNYSYNEYVNMFEVETPIGQCIPIYTLDNNNIYLSNILNDIIRKLGNDAIEGNKLAIPFGELVDEPIFAMNLTNNEFSAVLERIKHIINLESVTTSYDTHQLLQEFNDAVKEGGLGTTSVHLEIILMNQLRNVDNILDTPHWEIEGEECSILTLNQALTNNPSITVSMQYKLSNIYYNPLSFKKNKASYLDLLFMERPQLYFQNEGLYNRPKVKPSKKKPINLVSWIKGE